MLWIDSSNIWKILHFPHPTSINWTAPRRGDLLSKILMCQYIYGICGSIFLLGKNCLSTQTCIFLQCCVYNSHLASEETSSTSVSLFVCVCACDSPVPSTYSIVFVMNRPHSPNSRARPIYLPSVSDLSSGFSNYTSVNTAARRQQFDGWMRSMRSMWRVFLCVSGGL